MYRKLRNLSTEILVAAVFVVVGALTSITAAIEFTGAEALTNGLRLIIIVLLVGTSFLLIKKDADRK